MLALVKTDASFKIWQDVPASNVCHHNMLSLLLFSWTSGKY